MQMTRTAIHAASVRPVIRSYCCPQQPMWPSLSTHARCPAQWSHNLTVPNTHWTKNHQFPDLQAVLGLYCCRNGPLWPLRRLRCQANRYFLYRIACIRGDFCEYSPPFRGAWFTSRTDDVPVDYPGQYTGEAAHEWTGALHNPARVSAVGGQSMKVQNMQMKEVEARGRKPVMQRRSNEVIFNQPVLRGIS